MKKKNKFNYKKIIWFDEALIQFSVTQENDNGKSCEFQQKYCKNLIEVQLIK